VTPVLLFAVFVLTGYLAPHLLGRAQWLHRAPQLALAAWLTAALTAALAAVLAVATVAVPTAAAGHGLADLWHACLDGWRHYYGDNSLAIVTTAAVGLMIMAASLVRSAARHRRQVEAFRRAQHSGLAVLGGAADSTMVVLPHPTPAAYCVPGRPGRVVVTDGAVRVLESDQIRAVVAHERAHLAGRHDRLVGLATVLDRGLGWIAPVFRRARREIAALVEIIADDAALKQCAGPQLAAALVALADATVPRPALSAGGGDLAQRVDRLISPPTPLGPASRWMTRVLLVAFFMVPLATALAPVVAVVSAASCGDLHHL
jgi:Zn-dependent protease with chaperone function